MFFRRKETKEGRTKVIEAIFESKRRGLFGNLYADTLLLWYIVMAGGVAQKDRREKARSASA